MRSSPQNTRSEEPILQILPSAQDDKRCPAATGHDGKGTTASIYDSRRLQLKRGAELHQKARAAFGFCHSTLPVHKNRLPGARTPSEPPLEHENSPSGARTTDLRP